MEQKFQAAGIKRSILLKNPSCGCTPQVPDEKIFSQEFVTGKLELPAGTFPVISTILDRKDRWNHFKARTSSFRNNFTVLPGLYAAGSPSAESDVFISANYGMSFNYLRESLQGMNAWILVLDTKGINVWCAAGKGTFGTAELVSRIKSAGLESTVSHRRIILPQLGAPGIDAAGVQRQTGFRVMYGPVLAKDIKSYVAAGYKASVYMRQVKFGFMDRLVLVPMEIIPALKKYPHFFIITFLVFGLTPDGIIFKKALGEGLPFYAGGLLAVITGALVTPLFLPFIPFRSFVMKGLLAGLVVFIPLGFFINFFSLKGLFLQVSFVSLFTVVSSYLAVQFTGATTFTHISGVKKELKFAIPFYIVTAVLSFVLIICHKAGSMI